MRIGITVALMCMVSFYAMGQSPSAAGNSPNSDNVQQRVNALETEVEQLRSEVKELRALVAGYKDADRDVPSTPTPTTPVAVVATQTTAPPPAPSPSPELDHDDRVLLDSLKGTTLNVVIDTYYDYNFNHPVGRVNLLRAYDVLSNNFSLNQADMVLERAPDVAAQRRWGARLDLQYGQASDTSQGNPLNEPRPDIYRNIFQAYGTYVAPVGRGLTVDFGKWASSLGIEGNYTKDQMNYSRLQPGLCFTPIRPAPDGRLDILDSYASWKTTSRLTLALEGDYVIQRLWRESAPGRSSAPSHADGGAAYAQYQLNGKAAVAARAEYFSDRGGLFSGVTQALKETTATFDYQLAGNFLMRYEWRRDFSNQPSFLTDVANVLSKEQSTATVGLIWWFGGKQGAW